MQKPFLLLLRIFLIFLFIELMPVLVTGQVFPHNYNWKQTKKQIKGYSYYLQDTKYHNMPQWYIFQSTDFQYMENGDPDTFTHSTYYDKMFPNLEDSFTKHKAYKFKKAYYPYQNYYYNYYWHRRNKPEWIAEEYLLYSELINRIQRHTKTITLFNEDSLIAGYNSYNLLSASAPVSRSKNSYTANKIWNGWEYEKWNGNAWEQNTIESTDTFFNPANGSTEIINTNNNILNGYYYIYKTICYFDKDRKITNVARYYMNSNNNFWTPSDSFSDIKWYAYDKNIFYGLYNYGSSYILNTWANNYKIYHWERRDNSKWYSSGTFYKEYNKDSVIVTESKVYVDSTGNKDSTRTLYSYYPDGYHKQTLQQQWKNGQWITIRSVNTRNTYDADGDIIYSSETDEDAYSPYIYEDYRIYYHYTEGNTYRRKTPNHEYKVYPNPTMDEVNISVPDADSVSFKIGVYNTLGQLLMHVNQNVRDFKINLRNYPAGMYFLVFDSRSGRKTVKIIKSEAKTY